MSEMEVQIPKNWELKKLVDVCKLITSGGTPSRTISEYYDGDVPWVKIGDLNNGIISKTEEKISKLGLDNSSAKLFPVNTVLFGMYGGQSYSSGITGIAKIECATNQAICGLICGEKLDPHFLLYFLQGKVDEIRKMATGGAQLNLNQNKIKEFSIHLPLLETQKKIVAKLDHIFAKLDEKKKQIISRIEKFDANKITENYKNHLLKLAFDGSLTKSWRKSNLVNLNQSDVLEQLEKQKQIKSKLKISSMHKDELKNIPEGWIFTKLAFITSKVVDGTHFKPNYVNSGIPFISVKDVRNHEISFEHCKYITNEDHLKLIQRCNPEIDDVLLVKTGATIGRTAVIKTKRDFSLFVSVALIKPLKNFINPELLSLFLEHHVNQIDKDNFLKGGVLKNYHLEDLRGINVPLPTIEEQKIILKILDKKFADWENHKQELKNIQNQHELIKKHLNNLSSSILNEAFSGKLIH